MGVCHPEAYNSIGCWINQNVKISIHQRIDTLLKDLNINLMILMLGEMIGKLVNLFCIFELHSPPQMVRGEEEGGNA